MSKQQRIMRNRIIIVLIIFAVLLVADHIGVLSGINPIALFIIYAIPYLAIGYDVIAKAFRNIKNGQVFDENFLMMIATFAAFAIKDYDESLAVMLFYQIGELFQGYAVGKSRESIAQMMSIAPEYANLEGPEGLEEVFPEDVEVGSIVVVRAGEKIPLDGVVVEGESFVDTAALTGESVPQKVISGDDIISGCINKDSTLRVRVTKIYEDSTVARILELVEDASGRKAKLENFITRFAKYYTPVVTVCALMLAVVMPLVLGGGFAQWINRACIFLIVSCPCALVISVPLGFFGGIGAASKIGVLVKGGNFLEAASYMTTVVFDKTGTLTKGEFSVSKVLPVSSMTEDGLLEIAAHGERFSAHPIAESICKKYNKEIDISRVSSITEEPGFGITCMLDGKELLLGNEKLINKNGIEYEPVDAIGTIVYVALDKRFAGTIVISDSVKPEAKTAIERIRTLGVKKAVMLSGDKKETAEAVGREIGLDMVYSELLPADKVSSMEMLLSESVNNEKVGYVGDGINDAPVLMRADVGIAMGSMGSDAAIEAADIVLMDDNIEKIPAVISISKKTLSIVKQNIVFAIGVKLVVLVMGALGLATMWAAVFADVGVAVLSILNSMRTMRLKIE